MLSVDKKILIVDDDEINRMILSEMLHDDYELIEASDGQEAVDIMESQVEDIAMVLLDINMPKLNGFQVLEIMNQKRWIEETQVIMISSEDAPGFIEKAYDYGVNDFIGRPFHQAIVRRRIDNAMLIYLKQKQLIDLVMEVTKSRERDNNVMIAILSHIVEFRNGESGQHVININIITEMLLSSLIRKTDKYDEISRDIGVIKLASSLHDIGKISIPEEVLNKPGRYTKEEFEIMKNHSIAGANIIRNLELYEDEPVVKYSYQICRWHHERWDGKGYPDGLLGDEIPIAAQVVALADVYDALTSVRCYKSAYSHDESLRMIRDGECGAFNPILIECLYDISDNLEAELRKNDKYKASNNKKAVWGLLHES